MKTSSSLLLIAALSPATMLLPGCNKPDAAPTAAADPKTDVKHAATEVKKTAQASWESIKDYSYAKREDFATSLDRMGQSLDDELAAMTAKMKAMPDDAKQTHDAAIAEYDDASTAFNAQLASLRTATAQTWDANKIRTGAAWQRVRAAYDKLSS